MTKPDYVFSAKLVGEIIEELIQKTRYHMGRRQSAPYARAAKFVCKKHGIPVSSLYDRLIRRNP